MQRFSESRHYLCRFDQFLELRKAMKHSWAIILCKFTNDDGTPNDSDPFPMQHYQDLFTANDTGSSWNMVRYFTDSSNGQLDLTGTQVFGCYNPGHTAAEHNADHAAALDMLIG